MNIIKKIISNKKIIAFIMAIFTFFMLCLHDVIKSYSLLSWISFIFIFYIYYKVDILNPKYKKSRIVFSLIFSILLVYGEIAYKLSNNNTLSFFKQFISLHGFICVIGIFNILYALFSLILPKIYEYELKFENHKKSVKKVFLISFLVIFLCWLPYFLRYFPGILSSDSLDQLKTVIDNFSVVSDHHPVIHTLFIAGPYNIGYNLFNSVTIGVAFTTITQMLLMSSIFAYFITFLYKRNINKIILIVILCYYALLPMHSYYSITMWKDVIFSGILLLLTIQIVKIYEYESKNQLNLKKLIGFIIISLLCVFFRNNAVYMYALLAFFMLIVFRKTIKPFIISFIIVFGVYFVVKGPIFNYLNISKSPSAEYIAMPLQQVGRMAYKNIPFTEEEKETINKLIDVDLLAEIYNPLSVDDIKFNENFNREVFDKNKEKYLKLWLQLVVKHPLTALEAYSVSTLGYWYPNVENEPVYKEISENNYGLMAESKVPNSIEKIIDKSSSKGIPLFGAQWSIGLCFWIILIFLSACIKRKGKKFILIYMPIIGIWLTMMIAAPVFAEFRYVYGMFTCLPLLMLVPYYNKKLIK